MHNKYDITALPPISNAGDFGMGNVGPLPCNGCPTPCPEQRSRLPMELESVGAHIDSGLRNVGQSRSIRIVTGSGVRLPATVQLTGGSPGRMLLCALTNDFPFLLRSSILHCLIFCRVGGILLNMFWEKLSYFQYVRITYLQIKNLLLIFNLSGYFTKRLQEHEIIQCILIFFLATSLDMRIISVSWLLLKRC